MSEGRTWNVGRKDLECRKEELGMSEGRTWNVGRKDLECWKEGLGMPEGFDKTIYLIELPEPSLVSSVKINGSSTLLV
ncbi:hypothetical protein TVAG_512130 [Trichomonas vaginalis G3]|uniref:Uncharacterized protein n=1 Tax=Trichomonas vaginalis (strain ATCC PRA-98 / G3) TaxID=412133 RepID=A2H1Z2_TRIV3|nr:hypothetical protein TVAGG3_0917570 [Trichomonas vaginalis G3]EAX76576.1 hypothetical protein TVAG_512130 [Trichomonas vaginalis G3]KAI5484919.1 hypothetical protein TVAGG3_0917570 [Trichomonas vaginalis G3]|eukprot:XP_001289506.1 hypothetical protein [Trichomonas vaginalis G3]